MYILKKGNNIILKSDICVLATAPNLLAGGRDSGLVAFLNDYNLAVYAFKAFCLITLIST